MTNNNYNSSFSILPGPGFKNMLGSSYMEYLIGPNGMFSYVSPCYKGRAYDTFIFNNCAFVSRLEPNDQVMADRGFKVN
jgi:hypothetical protein